MPLNNEIEQRFGILPNFFQLASDTPEVTANLWGFARFAYLDNPLPSLFKERLFVYLSRFCEVRYCIARHIGFLVGLGYPSGDRTCPPQTVEQVLPLLQRPLPRGEALEPAIAFCVASDLDRFEFPDPDTAAESAIFACATHVFLQTPDAPRAIVALRQGLGAVRMEFLNVFLAFVRMAHYWTRIHPESRFEDDINHLLATHEVLADCLLNDLEVKDNALNQQVLSELTELRQLKVEHQSLQQAYETVSRENEQLSIELQQRQQSQSQPSETERRLELSLAGANLGIWTYNVSTDEFWADDRAKQMHGHAPHEVHTFAEASVNIHPEDRDRARTALFQAIRNHSKLQLEYRTIWSDSSIHGVASYAEFIPRGGDSQGKSTSRSDEGIFYGIVQDISDHLQLESDRTRAEQASRELEEQLHLFFTASSDIVYKMNADWSEMRYLQGKDFLTSTENPSGTWLEQYIPLSDRPRVMATIQAAIRTKSTFELEHRVIQRDGTVGWTFSRAIPLLDAQQEIVEWLGVASDITDREQAEIALQESEQRYRSLAIATSSIVWVAAGNGEILSAPAWEAFTGQTPEQYRGWGWFEMVHPDDRENTIRVWTHGIENKIPCEVEHRLMHHDKQYRKTVARAVPILDDAGNVREWVGTVTDITERERAEALLQASHDTFRHLVENSPFGVYVVDADFRLAQVSAGAQKVFENVRPLIGRDFAEALRVVWTEPFVSEAIALFRHTLKTGEPYRAPSTIERRQDIDRVESYDWKIERVTLPDGRFGVVCHFYDLSERQRYEAALRESEEQFRNLADSSPVLIWQTDETGVTFVNRYYLEFFAQTWDGVQGMGWANFLHPDDAAAYVGAYRAAFERQERYEFQCRFSRHDGEYRWLQNVGEPRYGLDRTFLGFVGCSVDVTDIKAIEAELQASEERFRNMADNAPMMVWVTNTTGYCTYLSRSWYDFTGQTEETGLGFGWLDATHPEDREASEAIFLSANERACAFQLEYRLRHQDGRYRTCIDTAKPWFGVDGQFKGYIGSVIDIDDRKQAELQLQQQASELIQLNVALERTTFKLSERNQELDRFVYTVSHDLKAPLRSIANLSQWLRDDLKEQLEAEYQYQLELLQSRVFRMEAMIDGLLAHSRVGRSEVATETVDVGELLAEILDSLMLPPTFTISIQSEMPTIVARRLLLSQVFSNLISNAIDHHDRPDGQIEIRVTQKGEYYEFSVADDGRGIAPEHHDRVFEIFQTLKGQNGRESTGIGLSIVKKIVETEGGSIVLESDLGEGATFRFTYPIVKKSSGN